jgi:basic membrane protein A and related proteins
VPGTDAVSNCIEPTLNLHGARWILATYFVNHKPLVVHFAKTSLAPQFHHATTLWNDATDPRNADSYFGYPNPPQFLDGVAAGLSTTSNPIGFVAVKPTGRVLSNINSLLMRARGLNLAVTVRVNINGDWSLPVCAANWAKAPVDACQDDIPCHVYCRKVVPETPEKRGVHSCGHNSSQEPMAPKGFITGAECKRQIIYKFYATDIKSGKMPHNFLARDYDADYVSNSSFGAGCSPEGRKAALAAIEGLKTGKPIYLNPLRYNKGKVIIDESYGAHDPYLNQILYLLDGVFGLISWLRRPPRVGRAGPPTRHDGRSSGCRNRLLSPPRRRGICSHSVSRHRPLLPAAHVVTAGDRQIAANLRRTCLARRSRRRVLDPKHDRILLYADHRHAGGAVLGALGVQHNRQQGSPSAWRLRQGHGAVPQARPSLANAHAHRYRDRGDGDSRSVDRPTQLSAPSERRQRDDLLSAADDGDTVQPVLDLHAETALMESPLSIFLDAALGGATCVSTPLIFIAPDECLPETLGRLTLDVQGALALGPMSACSLSHHAGSRSPGVIAAGLSSSLLGVMQGASCRRRDAVRGRGYHVIPASAGDYPILTGVAPDLNIDTTEHEDNRGGIACLLVEYGCFAAVMSAHLATIKRIKLPGGANGMAINSASVIKELS